MRKISNVVFLVILVAFFSASLFNNKVSGNISENENITDTRIPGRILVSFYQQSDERDIFRMENGEIYTTLNSVHRSRLDSYGLKKVRKFFQRDGRAIYELRINSGNEEAIISYLKTLPSVEHVQRDCRVIFFEEPNDYYYRPDSINYNGHHVADTMNILSQNCNANGGKSRWCYHASSPEYQYDNCCPDEYYYYTRV